ncbi:MAG: ComEC/Rec2 family competence protein [Parcubacteria group bacterium]
MVNLKKYWKEGIVLSLLVLNLLVWSAVSVGEPSKFLSVYFLDVGQGDAIFIETPSHGRVLIDGSATRNILNKLGEVIPFGDRRIDVVIETHPDKDHIGGLPEVVSRYNVGLFLEPGVESLSSIDDELKKRIKEKNIPNVLARRGHVLNFNDGVKLLILFPNQDVSNWETNDASIVAVLMYGEHSFLLTGDATKKTEYLLIGLNKEGLNTDVLKAGHHGSYTSTSLPFAEAVTPEYAIISSGKDNSYGHPHRETLETLNKVGAKILNTADLGTIHFQTDGINLIWK